MRPLTPDDLDLDLERYGARREAMRASAMALKEVRRIQLGDLVTFIFENRETLRHQVQEKLFTAQTATPEKVAEELGVHNPLLPSDHELSATVFLATRLADIENAVSLRIGHDVAKGVIATVDHVRFPLTDEQRDAFRDPTVPVELSVDHPAYAESTPVSGETRLSLLADLALDG